jgi:hypothetical protein
MNHPTQTEWLAYLDGETPPEHANRLLEHLRECPECAAEFAAWQRSVKKLQTMSFPQLAKHPGSLRWPSGLMSPVVKWGIAAAIVLFAGFAFDRLATARARALERTFAAQAHEELRRELRTDLLAALDPERATADGFQKQLRGDVETALIKAAAQNARTDHEAIQSLQRQRQQDQQRVLAIIKDVHDQQMSYYLALRQDLETAVSAADSGLRQDSRRINELADTLSTTH